MENGFRSLKDLEANPLTHLWIELTYACNLKCVHCYNDSGMHRRGERTLSFEQWCRVLDGAARAGCKSVQFIGGEPTMVATLPQLIAYARNAGFTEVEVFTNATRISDEVLQCFKKYEVQVALSLYGADAERHDAVTGRTGSFKRTVESVKRMLAAGLQLRAGVISTDGNETESERAMEFARKLGIRSVGMDQARAFGRAECATGRKRQMSELCGACWMGKLCVHPGGEVSCCIMSSAWPVGSVVESTLEEVLHSPALRAVRERIFREVWLPRVAKCPKCRRSLKLRIAPADGAEAKHPLPQAG